jgi:hypothetical protein
MFLTAWGSAGQREGPEVTSRQLRKLSHEFVSQHPEPQARMLVKQIRGRTLILRPGLVVQAADSRAAISARRRCNSGYLGLSAALKHVGTI